MPWLPPETAPQGQAGAWAGVSSLAPRLRPAVCLQLPAPPLRTFPTGSESWWQRLTPDLGLARPCVNRGAPRCSSAKEARTQGAGERPSSHSGLTRVRPARRPGGVRQAEVPATCRGPGALRRTVPLLLAGTVALTQRSPHGRRSRAPGPGCLGAWLRPPVCSDLRQAQPRGSGGGALTCGGQGETFAPCAVGVSSHLLLQGGRGLPGLRHGAGGASLRGEGAPSAERGPAGECRVTGHRPQGVPRARGREDT